MDKVILAGPMTLYKPGMYSWEVEKLTVRDLGSIKFCIFNWNVSREGEILWSGQTHNLRDAYQEIIYYLNSLQYGLPHIIKYDNVTIKGSI